MSDRLVDVVPVGWSETIKDGLSLMKCCHRLMGAMDDMGDFFLGPRVEVGVCSLCGRLNARGFAWRSHEVVKMLLRSFPVWRCDWIESCCCNPDSFFCYIFCVCSWL